MSVCCGSLARAAGIRPPSLYKHFAGLDDIHHGLISRAFRDLAEAAGLSAAVHFIDVPRETRWRQVEHRNETRGDTFAMHVDRGMFDFMETMWEPPVEAEWALNGGRHITP